MHHEKVLKHVAEALDITSPCKYVLRRSQGDKYHDFSRGEPNAWICQAEIEGARHSHFYEIFKDGDCAFDPLWPTRAKIRTISMRGYII